ncbi:hypothetical protein QX204_12470 [Nocardia sp. PE-7]|uniref:hypothetical protein n=1 Tax=Nocardia sp. PE-7 TaxID=3058426 RepID=UPI00265A985D|nr:hypothetical protein [Nocardia sp. PE-7]WKG12223.1 hypothetical protein QX204_12470 [Nocardia sp. PE-7]
MTAPMHGIDAAREEFSGIWRLYIPIDNPPDAPGKGLDRWITEYWNDVEHHWVRIDFEIVGQSILEHQKTSVLNSSQWRRSMDRLSRASTPQHSVFTGPPIGDQPRSAATRSRISPP